MKEELFNNGEALSADAVSSLNGSNIHTVCIAFGIEYYAFSVNIVLGVDGLTESVNNLNFFDSLTSFDGYESGSRVGENVKNNVGTNLVDAYISSIEVSGLSSVENLAVGRIVAVVVAYESNETAAPGLNGLVAVAEGLGKSVGVSFAEAVARDSITVYVADGSTEYVVMLIVVASTALRSDDGILYEVEGYAGISKTEFHGEVTFNGAGNFAGSLIVVQVVDSNVSKAGLLKSGVDAGSNAVVGEENRALFVAEGEVGTVEHGCRSVGTGAVVEPAEGFVSGSSHSVGVVTGVVAEPDYIVVVVSESSMYAIVAAGAVGALTSGEVLKEGYAVYSACSVVSYNSLGKNIVGVVNVFNTIGVAYDNGYVVSTSVAECERSASGEGVSLVVGNAEIVDSLGNGVTTIDDVGKVKAVEGGSTLAEDRTGKVYITHRSNLGKYNRGEDDFVLSRLVYFYIVNKEKVHVIAVLDDSNVDGLTCISGKVCRIFSPIIITCRNIDDRSTKRRTAAGVGGGNLYLETIGVACFVSHCFKSQCVAAFSGDGDGGSDKPTVSGTRICEPGLATNARSRITLAGNTNPSLAVVLAIGGVVVVEHSPTGRNSAIIETFIEDGLSIHGKSNHNSCKSQ